MLCSKSKQRNQPNAKLDRTWGNYLKQQNTGSIIHQLKKLPKKFVI